MPMLSVTTDVIPLVQTLTTVIGAIVAAYVAIMTTRNHVLATDINKVVAETKIVADKTSVNVDGNLTDVKAQLAVQNRRWEALSIALAQHPDAASIFKDLVEPVEAANPPAAPTESKA